MRVPPSIAVTLTFGIIDRATRRETIKHEWPLSENTRKTPPIFLRVGPTEGKEKFVISVYKIPQQERIKLPLSTNTGVPATNNLSVSPRGQLLYRAIITCHIASNSKPTSLQH